MTVKFDYDRSERIGMPEAVLCQGKDISSLKIIANELAEKPDFPVLFTRFAQSQYDALPQAVREKFDYDALSRTGFLNGTVGKRRGTVAVVAAGTADLRVSREACRTLDFMGVENLAVTDVGVAGLWRLQERIEEIKGYDVVIVIAGMDAALASVVGGLVAKPVIGVPTSEGYGVAADGSSALHSMLASCAQGVVVTNIDNGFGGACAALRILGNDHV